MFAKQLLCSSELFPITLKKCQKAQGQDVDSESEALYPTLTFIIFPLFLSTVNLDFGSFHPTAVQYPLPPNDARWPTECMLHATGGGGMSN